VKALQTVILIVGVDGKRDSIQLSKTGGASKALRVIGSTSHSQNLKVAGSGVAHFTSRVNIGIPCL